MRETESETDLQADDSSVYGTAAVQSPVRLHVMLVKSQIKKHDETPRNVISSSKCITTLFHQVSVHPN